MYQSVFLLDQICEKPWPWNEHGSLNLPLPQPPMPDLTCNDSDTSAGKWRAICPPLDEGGSGDIGYTSILPPLVRTFIAGRQWPRKTPPKGT